MWKAVSDTNALLKRLAYALPGKRLQALSEKPTRRTAGNQRDGEEDFVCFRIALRFS